MWDLIASLFMGIPLAVHMELTPLWSGAFCMGIYMALSALGHA